jgi:hypothetical protein
MSGGALGARIEDEEENEDEDDPAIGDREIRGAVMESVGSCGGDGKKFMLKELKGV